MKKDIVIGLGEIGLPIFKLLSKTIPTEEYDKNQKLINKKQSLTLKKYPVDFLHICIPYTNDFNSIIIKYVEQFNPKGIIIHSTIPPYTTMKLQKKLDLPVVYSATRGIHKRMLKDLKRYTKFYSVYDWAPNSKWANKNFENRMKKIGIKTKKMKDPLTLELAKIIVDTSYYGWLINYAQLSMMITLKHKVDFDEMWSFADEIHKFLGNRPKMFPGFIGGHCVIPNLALIDDDSLNIIKEINSYYAQILKCLQNKKYKVVD